MCYNPESRADETTLISLKRQIYRKKHKIKRNPGHQTAEHQNRFWPLKRNQPVFHFPTFSPTLHPETWTVPLLLTLFTLIPVQWPARENPSRTAESISVWKLLWNEMFSTIQSLMYKPTDNWKKELNIMKVFNLYPLLFINIMALIILLSRPVEII